MHVIAKLLPLLAAVIEVLALQARSMAFVERNGTALPPPSTWHPRSLSTNGRTHATEDTAIDLTHYTGSVTPGAVVSYLGPKLCQRRRVVLSKLIFPSRSACCFVGLSWCYRFMYWSWCLCWAGCGLLGLAVGPLRRDVVSRDPVARPSLRSPGR
ncbi:unnamed protein product [Prorocentrum cordatum]|uniref:Secreted protein n=1 Tax=Prorocentrum cordatum TaxID=2364126 RepID=A0ABN9W4E4_9DINO|nr:unnamed protein product [Polarella glacialis]